MHKIKNLIIYKQLYLGERYFLKRAFTLAEAILTMVILGIIAAVMITALRPQQYNAKGFLLQKQRIFMSVDEAILTILQDCSLNMGLTTIYDSCDRSKGFASYDARFMSNFPLFMKGIVNGCSNAKVFGIQVYGTRNFKMKSGACLYFKPEGYIYVDVNGSEGPNNLSDQFVIEVASKEGVVTGMPQKLLTNFAGGISGCAESSGDACTKCYCGYTLSSGTCTVSTNVSYLKGCSGVSYIKNETLYLDSACTVPYNNDMYCDECATEQLSSTTLYKINTTSGKCITVSVPMLTCAETDACEPW